MRLPTRRFDSPALASGPPILVTAHVLVLVCCGHKSEDISASTWRVTHGAGFRLTAPDSLSLHETRGTDFQVYALASPSGDALLPVYSGNFRSPIRISDSIVATFQSKRLMSDTTIRWRSSAELVGRETLVRIGKGVVYPEFLHVWYDSLTPAAAADGDSIIHTIRPEPMKMPR